MARKMNKVHFQTEANAKPPCGVHPWDDNRKDGTSDKGKVTCFKCRHHKVFLEAENADE